MPQVAQVATAASLEIRPPVAQRNDDNSFSELLPARDDVQPEEPPSRDAASADARPAKQDRDPVDRTSRRDDSDRATQDARTDTSKADSSDQASANGKSKDASDSSADAKGKSKETKSGDKSAADAAVASAPAANDATVAVNPNAQAAVAPAPAIPADAGEALDAAPADAAQSVDAAPPSPPQAPQMPQPQAPQAAQAPAPGTVDAQIDAAAQAALNEKPAAKTKTDSAPQVPQPSLDDAQTAAAEQPLPAAKQASIDAAAQPAPKFAPSPQPQDGKPAIQDQSPASANVVADAAAKPGMKPETANTGNRESLEDVLAKHFSGDIHVTSNSQIVLPDPARALQNTVPMSVSLQTSASAATNQPVPLQAAALAIEIASRAKDGSRQFDIRLDPPELGRIDVKLDVDKSGQVNTHLTVDRPETLDLLRRDSQGLERALQQAGLKTSDGGLEFSLRQQTPDGAFQGRNQAQANPQGNTPSAVDIDQTATLQAEQYQWAARLRGGVDIRV